MATWPLNYFIFDPGSRILSKMFSFKAVFFVAFLLAVANGSQASSFRDRVISFAQENVVQIEALVRNEDTILNRAKIHVLFYNLQGHVSTLECLGDDNGEHAHLYDRVLEAFWSRLSEFHKFASLNYCQLQSSHPENWIALVHELAFIAERSLNFAHQSFNNHSAVGFLRNIVTDLEFMLTVCEQVELPAMVLKVAQIREQVRVLHMNSVRQRELEGKERERIHFHNLAVRIKGDLDHITVLINAMANGDATIVASDVEMLIRQACALFNHIPDHYKQSVLSLWFRSRQLIERFQRVESVRQQATTVVSSADDDLATALRLSMQTASALGGNCNEGEKKDQSVKEKIACEEEGDLALAMALSLQINDSPPSLSSFGSNVLPSASRSSSSSAPLPSIPSFNFTPPPIQPNEVDPDYLLALKLNLEFEQSQQQQQQANIVKINDHEQAPNTGDGDHDDSDDE